MGKRIEAIKRMQQSSPQEVMAAYLWNYVVNSKDQFWKTKYYDQTAYFELNHDGDAYMIDVLYMGQETSFPLNAFMRPTPDYKSALAVAPSILEWLGATYAMYCPLEPPRPRRSRQDRVAQQPSRGQNGAGNGVQKRPQNAPKNGLKNTL